MLFWRVNLVSFIRIGIREEKEGEDDVGEEDGDEREREEKRDTRAFECAGGKKRGNNRDVAHTKFACCFYWYYSSDAMRDVTPRQLRERAHAQTLKVRSPRERRELQERFARLTRTVSLFSCPLAVFAVLTSVIKVDGSVNQNKL